GGGGGGCSDSNANCVSWATNGFCSNPGYTPAMIKQYCCKTCSSPPPLPTTNCGVLYEGSDILDRPDRNVLMTPILNNAPLTKVFVK
ncbi:hypothetical protein PMAYCL1PPCAC_10562, partial [Pristionchus mayeri]